jgi:hypothetical protein
VATSCSTEEHLADFITEGGPGDTSAGQSRRSSAYWNGNNNSSASELNIPRIPRIQFNSWPVFCYERIGINSDQYSTASSYKHLRALGRAAAYDAGQQFLSGRTVCNSSILVASMKIRILLTLFLP